MKPKKILTNRYIILIFTILLCIMIALTYSIKQPNLIVVNFLGMLFVVLSSIISRGFFLFAVDYLTFLDNSFKVRIIYVLKSLFLSMFILFPISFALFVVSLNEMFSYSLINKIIIFSVSYLSPICLFYSFKITSNRNWFDTLKVVSLSIMSMLFSDFLIKII